MSMDSPATLLKKGMNFLQSGDSARAIECFNNLVRKDPGVASYRVLGSAYLLDNDPKSAAVWFKKALELAPSDPSLRGEYGLALFRQNLRAEAKPYLDGAWKADPGDEEVGVALARMAMANREFPAAIGILRRLAGRELQDMQTPLLMLADCYIAERKVADAEAVLIRAIDLNPESARAHCALVSLHLLAGRDDVAYKELTVLLSVFPDDPEINATMGNLWLMRRNSAAARPYYLKAIAANPPFIPAYNSMAAILMADGDREGSLELIGKVLSMEPENVDALRVAAMIAEIDQDYPRALTLAKNALAQNPDDFSTNLIGARCSIRLQAPVEQTNSFLDKAAKAASTPKDQEKVDSLRKRC